MSQAVNNETWNVVTSQADVKYMIAFGLLGRNIIFLKQYYCFEMLPRIYL